MLEGVENSWPIALISSREGRRASAGAGAAGLKALVRGTALIRWELSHAQPQRMFADVPFGDEGALDVFAVQVDFVLAGDAFRRRASRVRKVYPNFAIGDAVAFAVRDATITKDINVGPLFLPDITASHRAGWKTDSGKQNEFSRRRRTVNFA
jgi:hypothetical protein